MNQMQSKQWNISLKKKKKNSRKIYKLKQIILQTTGAQDDGMWNGRVRVDSAENENLEKLKVKSSLGEVTER